MAVACGESRTLSRYVNLSYLLLFPYESQLNIELDRLYITSCPLILAILLVVLVHQTEHTIFYTVKTDYLLTFNLCETNSKL